MPLTPKAALNKDTTMPSGRDVMQHRHFATVAAIIASLRLAEPAMSHVIKHFADELGATNSKFDRARFMAACRANKEG